MDADRRVRVCPAALRDLQMLLPRRASRAIVLRHVRKLQRWTRCSDYALDLAVAEVPQSAIRELCVEDCFGFSTGIRLAFFEDALTEPNGQLWVIGSRRADELLSKQMMDTLNHRKEMIENHH